MERTEDYNTLERLEPLEEREVLVLYSNLIYRGNGSGWILVGKVTADGKVVYRR